MLILDEPDSHLHPDNQRALCNLITDLAQRRGFRALNSTHSRHVLDTLGASARIEWLSNGEKVDYGSVSVASRLMDLGALDSIDYFMGDQLRCLFATEDSSAESLTAIGALLTSNGFRMEHTEVRAYAGCSKIDSAKVLRNFLADKAPRVKFVVHRDRDYMPADKCVGFEQAIVAIDARPFLTRLNDVESYFLNAQHLAHLNPGLTAERAQAVIEAATLETETKSIEQLINVRMDQAQKDRNGGPPPNAGQLATAARNDYLGDPSTYRRGKLVLKRVTHVLRGELGRAPVVLMQSPHLVDESLTAIRNFIWPPEQATQARPRVAVDAIAAAAAIASGAREPVEPAAVTVGGEQAARDVPSDPHEAPSPVDPGAETDVSRRPPIGRARRRFE